MGICSYWEGGASAPRISPDFPHKVLKDTAPQTTGAVVPPDFPWPLGAKPAQNWFQRLWLLFSECIQKMLSNGGIESLWVGL